MEQIKRANRLYTSDTIFLKPTLLIPRRLGPEEEEKEEEEEGDAGPGAVLVSPATSRHELSAADFLRQIDAEICLSKAAATRRLCESNTRCGATFQVPEGDGGRKGTALRSNAQEAQCVCAQEELGKVRVRAWRDTQRLVVGMGERSR
nr:PREDICTED: lysM and putative peptidoglycan-binding domain-containing protein 1 isoform X4 [Struthio camelus australis]